MKEWKGHGSLRITRELSTRRHECRKTCLPTAAAARGTAAPAASAAAAELLRAVAGNMPRVLAEVAGRPGGSGALEAHPHSVSGDAGVPRKGTGAKLYLPRLASEGVQQRMHGGATDHRSYRVA